MILEQTLYFKSFFQRHFQSCLSYRPLTSNAGTKYYLIGNIGSAIYLNAVLFYQKHKRGGGGGGSVSQF